MNKENLIQTVFEAVSSAREGLSKAAVKDIFDAIFDKISDAVSQGDDVTLIGFGTFTVKQQSERKGRNPSTGKEMIIPAKKVLKFRVGKQLKEKING
jgi:DNA-binding protein HU-beta